MRFREHIRSNVIGYIALFAFAMSGTASALDGSDTVFSDDIVNGEVKSADIAHERRAHQRDPERPGRHHRPRRWDRSTDAEAAPHDERHGRRRCCDGDGSAPPTSPTAPSARARSRTARSPAPRCSTTARPEAGSGPRTWRPNAVAQAEIATDGVAATEIQNNSIDAGEIVDFGLTNQDVGVLFAEVSATGVLDNHSGGVTVTRIGAAGTGQYEVDFGRNIALCTSVATIGLAGAGAPVAGEVYVADRSGNAEAVFVDTNTSAGAAADRAFRLVVVC